MVAFGDHTFKAGIDTGFTGFLCLPFLDAVKPGLIFRGVIPVTLADGNSQSFTYCLGEVQLNSKIEIGIVIITPSNQALVGMEFLRQFGLRLVVDATNNTTTLTDDPDLTQPTNTISSN